MEKPKIISVKELEKERIDAKNVLDNIWEPIIDSVHLQFIKWLNNKIKEIFKNGHPCNDLHFEINQSLLNEACNERIPELNRTASAKLAGYCQCVFHESFDWKCTIDVGEEYFILNIKRTNPTKNKVEKKRKFFSNK